MAVVVVVAKGGGSGDGGGAVVVAVEGTAFVRVAVVLKKEGGRYDHDHRFNGFFLCLL